MDSKAFFKNFVSLTVLGSFFIFIMGACSPSGQQATPTPTKAFGSDGGDEDPPQLTCSSEKTLFNLWFSHLSVLDIDAGDGETFYLKFENTPPSYFQLWIEPSGEISTEHTINETKIGYQGTFNHPDDDDCPVQTFDGIWEMKAAISGVCKNNIVNLHITEEWIDPELHSDCGDAIGPGPGLYSAPELDLVFDLSEDYPADGVTIPEGGPFHASYDYYLYPAEFEFEIPPLVPEQ
ncbi:MAG: hypothetical protein WBB69_03580 [Anaerolineales bacterium]